MDIRHVVVLMLENRSFDSMLGMLYQSGAGFDGLTGNESNIWHKPDGSQQAIRVWNDPVAVAAGRSTSPIPIPASCSTDIHTQIYGLGAGGTPGSGPPAMSGFVDNYVRQPATRRRPIPIRSCIISRPSRCR